MLELNQEVIFTADVTVEGQSVRREFQGRIAAVTATNYQIVYDGTPVEVPKWRVRARVPA